MVRLHRLGFLLAVLFAAPAFADERVAEGDLSLTVTVEDLPQPPFVDEMVLLTIHGAYKIPISLENLEQPDLDGFDWMQLGEDSWYETADRGLKVVNFKRVMALFPNRAGTLEIAPFTHRLTLLTHSGERFDRDVVSPPVTLEVLPPPESEDWWLPVREISVEDNWSNAPDKLGPGEGALRVVAMTVSGVKPSQIPPMPNMEAAGALVFPHPPKQIVTLRAWGPATRVFWRWTVRPLKPPSAYLKPIRLPYFDTGDRTAKEIVIAAQRIAMSDEAIAVLEDGQVFAEESGAPVERSAAMLGAVAMPFALLAGLAGGLGLLITGARMRSRSEMLAWLRGFLPDPDVRVLKRAARTGDAAAARSAAVRLMDRASGQTAIAQVIAALDRQLYGPNPEPPDLRAFARRVLKARRSG